MTGGKNRPTVLFVALQTGAGANGGIASLGEILLALDRYRPVVLTNQTSRTVERWRDAGVEVAILPEEASLGLRRAPARSAVTYWRYWRAVGALLRRTGARIVHANDPLAFQLSVAAARQAGVAAALSIRDTLDPSRPAPRRRYHWIFGSADHVFYLSHDMRRRWQEVSALAGRRSSVTGSVVDFARFPATPLPQRKRRSVLVSGVVCPKKGQALFLDRAGPRLAAAGVTMRLVGDFNPVDSFYAAQCRELAGRLGDAVELLGYRPDIPELMAAADLVCVPSRYEGLMRSMIEAMSLGRPVVSTAVASAAEMLRMPGREAGTVMPLDFGEDMADAILDVLAERTVAQTMGRNGSAIARELFNRDRVIAAYQDQYDRLARTRRG